MRSRAYAGSIMSDFDQFETVFGRNGHLAYDGAAVAEIRRRREDLEGELFIDRLLKALGLQNRIVELPCHTFYVLNEIVAHKIYPPASNSDLRRLHQQITDSTSPEHHKHSVIYYIVKDVPQKKHRLQDKFAEISYLPARYRIFIDGIWSLDRLELEVSGLAAKFSGVKLADETRFTGSLRSSDAALIDTNFPR